jgi:hypothetical protein
MSPISARRGHTGIGMTPEQQVKLFEEFTQADSATAPAARNDLNRSGRPVPLSLPKLRTMVRP